MGRASQFKLPNGKSGNLNSLCLNSSKSIDVFDLNHSVISRRYQFTTYPMPSDAYGQVSYVRYVNNDSEVSCRLVTSKSRIGVLVVGVLVLVFLPGVCQVAHSRYK